MFIQDSSVSSLALLFDSLSKRTEVTTEHEFILFFCAGANPNALWANWDGFVSSLASLFGAFFLRRLANVLTNRVVYFQFCNLSK